VARDCNPPAQDRNPASQPDVSSALFSMSYAEIHQRRPKKPERAALAAWQRPQGWHLCRMENHGPFKLRGSDITGQRIRRPAGAGFIS